MRTTLDIEDDVLQAVKELAGKERLTAGAVISRLARKGLHTPQSAEPVPQVGQTRNGIRMLPRRGEIVTLAHVQKLLDEEGV